MATLKDYELLAKEMVEAALRVCDAVHIPGKLNISEEWYEIESGFEESTLGDKENLSVHCQYLLNPSMAVLFCICALRKGWEEGEVYLWINGMTHNMYFFDCKLDEDRHMVARQRASR